MGTAESGIKKTINTTKTMKTTEIQKTIAACFASIVGQSRLIANRILAHSAYVMGSDAPTSILISGAAGLGKTAILRADLAARKAAVEIRAQREAETLFLRSPQDIRLAGDAYFSFVEHVQNGDGQVADELHEMDMSPTVQTRKLKAILKGLLDNGQGPIRRVRLDDDTTISRHVSEIYFGAGTNYPEKIKDGPAIISRFGGEIPLELYTAEDLAVILIRMAEAAGLRVHPDTVALIARCGRGTARPLESIVAHLSRVAVTAGKSTINRTEALDAMRALALFPLGVSEREVSILLASRNAGIPARMIPIRWAIEPKAAGLSIAFLSSLGFVAQPKAGLIQITTKGDAYLQQLRDERFTLPA